MIMPSLRIGRGHGQGTAMRRYDGMGVHCPSYEPVLVLADYALYQDKSSGRNVAVDLVPSIAEAFLADEIGVGHSLEIAKLPQQEQQRQRRPVDQGCDKGTCCRLQ